MIKQIDLFWNKLFGAHSEGNFFFAFLFLHCSFLHKAAWLYVDMSVAEDDKKIKEKALQTFPLTLILQIIKPNPNLFLSAVFY